MKNIDFFNKLKKLHTELEEKVPYLEKVQSLINARNTRGIKDELIVGELFKDFPTTYEQVEVLKKRIMENPLYENIYISKDGKYTSIIVKTQLYSSEGINEDNEGEIDGFENESNVKKDFLRWVIISL